MKAQIFFLLLICFSARAQKYDLTHSLKDSQGATFRGDTTKKEIYLIFTGHEFADGGTFISQTLAKNQVKASFFFTGQFYRNNPRLAANLKNQGHYLGAHSDRHLLYCDWTKRDSMLVSDELIIYDLRANYRELEKLGIEKNHSLFFMPPYEWYNKSVVRLLEPEGLIVVNFSPGTSTNADYTIPGAKNYLSSKEILDKLYKFEKSNRTGLNGFHLLIHIGTDPKRTDKLYASLDEIIRELKQRGYSFHRF